MDERLDPEYAQALSAYTFTIPDPLLPEHLPALRARPLPALVQSDAVTAETITLPGDPPVPARTYRPHGGEGSLAAFLYIHGGGYLFGSHLGDDPRLSQLSESLGCFIVSVGYRLAPEHPFPAPLEDCYTALAWIHDEAEALGVDRRRIGIGGRSAGGGLAAALALLARDRGRYGVACQYLNCPMIDDRQVTPSSLANTLVWPPTANRFGWQCYLGELYGADVPYHAAPARATDLTGLPPAFVTVGALDPFLDEDLNYARRLDGAGVATELHVYPGVGHAFEAGAPGIAVSRRSLQAADAWLDAMLSAR